MVGVEHAARFGDVDGRLVGQPPRAARPSSRGGCGSCPTRARHPRSARSGAAPCGPPARPRAASSPCRSRPTRSATSWARPASPSPSWRWMAAICSRSTASFCRSSKVALVWRPISAVRPQHFEPVRQDGHHLVDARHGVDRLDQLLLLLGREVEIGGDEVGQLRRVARVLHGADEVGGRLRQELQGLERHALQVREARLDVGRALLGLDDEPHARPEEGLLVQELFDLEAGFALHHHVVLAVRRRDVAQHVGDRAEGVEVARRGLLPWRRPAASGCRSASPRAPPAGRPRSSPPGRARWGTPVPGNSTVSRTGRMISVSPPGTVARAFRSPAVSAEAATSKTAGRRASADRPSATGWVWDRCRSWRQAL